MLKGLGALGNLGAMMGQAREMGEKMKAAQSKLKTMRVTGAAGGGLVEVEVNGAGEAMAVKLDADLVSRGDREMLEDLLPAAFNAAKAKAEELHQQAMQEATGDLNLPGLGDMLKNLGEPPAGT